MAVRGTMVTESKNHSADYILTHADPLSSTEQRPSYALMEVGFHSPPNVLMLHINLMLIMSGSSHVMRKGASLLGIGVVGGLCCYDNSLDGAVYADGAS